MTEQEIRTAKRIKDVYLPKLQEIQRDIFLDRHIFMDVNPSTYKMCVNVYIHVVSNEEYGAELLCCGMFSFSTYHWDERQQEALNMKQLRGIQHFIKNWQKRFCDK